MTRSLPFVKMQGLGNDFLIIDLRPPADPGVFPDGAAVGLCDRHFGVGGDGVLLVLPSAVGAARMRVLNADGSEAEMCGNGLRCVARYLWERGARGELNIETGAGVLRCEMAQSGAGVEVEIAMGRPGLKRGEVPMQGPAGELAMRVPLRVGERTFEVTGVSMGNPHAVVFVEAGESLRELAAEYGPRMEHHEVFPRQANVSFARQAGSDEVDLVVWERGCGITLACGTGACATAVAAGQLGLFPAGRPLQVRLPGGVLQIRVTPGVEQVYMRGPAVEVFRGEVQLSATV